VTRLPPRWLARFPNGRLRSWLPRGLLLAGILVVGSILGRAIPRECQLIFKRSSPAAELRQLRLEVLDSEETLLVVSDLRPQDRHARRLVVPIRLTPGHYALRGWIEVRVPHSDEKTTWGDWTRVGFQHQVELEGRDLTFPLPPGPP